MEYKSKGSFGECDPDKVVEAQGTMTGEQSWQQKYLSNLY
jgi:hypothetical protein